MPEHEFPCDECGGLVSLESLIWVSYEDDDGKLDRAQLPEWKARLLLDELCIPKPPVLCDKHERTEIVTEAMPELAI